MDILEGLNDAQKKAVRTTGGPLLILAGAGSGKTKTLTHRIAYLLAHEHIEPEQILAVTFTNKAAREMRERLGALLGVDNPPRSFMPWMGTFHSICIRILRADGHRIGVPSNFVIYDEDDRRSLIKQFMDVADDKKITKQKVSAAISRAKNDLIGPDEYNSHSYSPLQHVVAEVYPKYEAARRVAGALDFDDILTETVRLLNDEPEIRRKYQDKFRHIFIDEYQDTNAAQYAIVKKLVNKDQNICVVGDDWQCLPAGTSIETSAGTVPVERITRRHHVKAAAGYGKTGFFAVTHKKSFAYDGELIGITTASGKHVEMTPNHITFARLSERPGAYYVYLMYVAGTGYRIGLAKSSRFDGKRQDVGLRVRANQERADRMWILKVCQTRGEAQYYEALYSYTYGIPMVVFRADANRSMQLTQQQIDALYDSIDTEPRAASLMHALGIHFDYPHFVPQATIRGGTHRVHANIVLFGDRRQSARSPWSASRLSINTSDQDAMAQAAAAGHVVRRGKSGALRTEAHRLDYADIEQLAATIDASLENVIFNRYAFLTDHKQMFMPASQLHVGMQLPTEQDGYLRLDEITAISRRKYKGRVYDLDVHRVHNYLAGGTAVHNSIYSWRGADFTNILGFERDFPGATVVKLEQNYRSTGSILDIAQKVITKNVERTDKELWTDRGEGQPVEVMVAYNDDEEAYRVAQIIEQKVRGGSREFSDVAVLYRTNAQSATFERMFNQFGIPYRLIGSRSFLDREVVKDILAHLKLIYQPLDRASFMRIVNKPKRGVGQVTLDKFLTWQTATERTIIAALNEIDEMPGVSSKVKDNLKLFGQTLAGFEERVLSGSIAPSELIDDIANRTMYYQYINDDKLKASDRLEHANELSTWASEYSTIEEFLASAMLVSSSDAENARGEVALMTVHAAKGLEFPIVFIVGMEQNLFPLIRGGFIKPEELEEERRLCYVSVTRAREELYLTYAKQRRWFGSVSPSMASQFFDDMGLATKAPVPHSYNTGAHNQDEFFDDMGGFDIGDRVESRQFGSGEIIDIDGLAVSVRFDSGATKKLNVEFARLKKMAD